MQEKRNWDDIVMPENLDKVIMDSVERGSRRSKAGKWKRLVYPLAGAAAALTVFFGAGLLSPAVLSAMERVPVLGNIFQYLYDLTGYDGNYTQLAENVHLAAPPEEAGEPGAQNDAVEKNEAQDNTANEKREHSGDGADQSEAVVTDEDGGITITVPQYYCDGENLFLSMEITSSTPFFTEEEELNGERKEGMIQLFVKSDFDFLDSETGAGLIPDWKAEGVYLDDYTFVGIAKGKIGQAQENGITVPKQFVYTANVTHFKAYCQDLGVVADARGTWQLRMEAQTDDEQRTDVMVNAFAENGYGILDVSLSPYEFSVSVVPDSNTAEQEEEYVPYWVVVFDQDHTMVKAVTPEINRAYGEYDRWFFVNSEELQTLDIYVVEEEKWLEEWKGLFYQDNGISEQELQDVLEENCFVKAQVELPDM